MSDNELNVIDANVLIDFLDTEENLLHLYSKHISTLVTPEQVFDEVKQLSESKSEQLLIQIPTATDEQVNKALDLYLTNRRNTFPDYLCYIFARDLQSPLITNDTRLSKYCSLEGIEVIRGLRVILILFENSLLDEKNSMKYAKEMIESNKWLKEILFDEFVIELGKLSDK